MTSAWYHPALGLLWSDAHPAGIEPLRCCRVAIDPEPALALSDLDLAHLARRAGMTPSHDTARLGRVVLAEVAARLNIPVTEPQTSRQLAAQPAR